MRLTAIHGDEEHLLTIEGDEEEGFRVEIGGRERQVDARPMEGNTWLLLIDGQSYEADIEVDRKNPDGLTVRVRGEDFPMEMLDERRMRMREVSAGFVVEGRVTVCAPMPGKVVKVLAPVGSTVEEGQGVVVVEAMKMENELRAPKAGKVIEVKAAEGDAVEGGTVLLVLE